MKITYHQGTSNTPENSLFGIWKMKMLILSVFSLSAISCSIPGSHGNQSGYIGFSFKFPDSADFSVKAIPASTDKINIKISYIDNTGFEPINKTLKKDEANEKVFIEDIPVGRIKIDVEAINIDNKTVAKATENATIIPGEITTKTIELKSLFSKLKLVLNNYPADGGVTIAEIKPKGGKPIYLQFSGSEKEIDDVETGNAPVRLTVFKDDATPLAIASTTVDVGKSETAEINLTSLELPNLSDLAFGTGIPTQLLQTLSKILIEVPGNNKPELKNINVVVKGPARPLTFSKDKPLCLNQGDQFDINVSSTDKDDDPINYIWGLTSIFDNGQFKMKLLPEKGPSVSRTVDLPVGGHSLGLIITDKKSFVGPISIYLNVQQQPCNL